jgi:SAM-dependent methyltransferase
MRRYTDPEIASFVKEYARGSQHPDQKVYSELFLDGLRFEENGGDIYLKVMRQLVEVGDMEECRVLEAGCGMGWDALALSMLGSNQVVACDILPSMIDACTESIANLRARGVAFQVSPLLGDICDLDLPPESFDVVCSIEAVEHVHDLERMFKRCAYLLKRGGRLVVTNGSNVHNPEFVSETVKMWVERDRSWEHMEVLRKLRPVEHAEAKPYAAMREAIVREANPSLSSEDCAAIVSATAGMIRPEIALLARDYAPGMKLPTPPEYSWCRNPETGEYAERLLDPFEIAALIEQAGFGRVRVMHAFRRLPLRLANSIQFGPLNRYLFGLRAGWIVAGVKP